MRHMRAVSGEILDEGGFGMLVALYSVQHVYGADVWLIAAVGCAAAYLVLCGLFRRNRSRRGIAAVVLGLLAAEMICDWVWASAFYPGGEYRNYGLGGSYMLVLIWPGLLLLTGWIVTWINRNA